MYRPVQPPKSLIFGIWNSRRYNFKSTFSQHSAPVLSIANFTTSQELIFCWFSSFIVAVFFLFFSIVVVLFPPFCRRRAPFPCGGYFCQQPSHLCCLGFRLNLFSFSFFCWPWHLSCFSFSMQRFLLTMKNKMNCLLKTGDEGTVGPQGSLYESTPIHPFCTCLKVETIKPF